MDGCIARRVGGSGGVDGFYMAVRWTGADVDGSTDESRDEAVAQGKRCKQKRNEQTVSGMYPSTHCAKKHRGAWH